MTHSLFDVTGEHVDLEVLRAPVTLSEGEAVGLHRTLFAPSTEQNLVDGERRKLCPRGLVHDPETTIQHV